MKHRSAAVRGLFPLTAVAVIGLLFIGAPNAMSLLNDKLPLTDPWKERFMDVTKLNAYAKTQRVELANVEIKNKNIDGMTLNGGKFENTEWNEISAKKANLTNVVFRKGTLENVDFTDSMLTDVVFEDMTLREVRFFGPTLNNVRFVRCELDAVNIDRTKASRIEIIDSKVENSSLSDGQLVAVFRNSKLSDQTALTDLIPPSSLTFEKCELSEVNMDRSKLKELVIHESKFDGVLKSGSADSISMRDSTVDTSFSGTTIGSISVGKGVISKMIFNRTKVNSMSITNCVRSETLSMYEANIGTADIVGCALIDFSPVESTIGILRIKDSSISNSEFQKMKAKTVILDNVTLDGELDFTNAHIGELKTKNVTKQPGLKLITTGSNVRF